MCGSYNFSGSVPSLVARRCLVLLNKLLSANTVGIPPGCAMGSSTFISHNVTERGSNDDNKTAVPKDRMRSRSHNQYPHHAPPALSPISGDMPWVAL